MTLLPNFTCILALLLLAGDCAVIPGFSVDSAEPETALDHKWDTITRLRSRMGAKDTSTLDHLVHTAAKMPDSPKNWPLTADTAPQRLRTEAKMKVVKDTLRSGKEIEVVRLTKPLAVKQTAGHVGYEERHRFSGVRFDKLLGGNVPLSEATMDANFRSDDEFDGSVDSGSDTGSGTGSGTGSDGDSDGDSDEDTDSDDECEDGVDGFALQRDDGTMAKKVQTGQDMGLDLARDTHDAAADDDDDDDDSNDTDDENDENEGDGSVMDPSESLHKVEQPGQENTRQKPSIHWEASSKSKVLDLAESKKPLKKIHWQTSSQSKVASEAPTADPVKKIHWKESSQSKVALINSIGASSEAETQPKHDEIHWIASSQSKVAGAMGASNRHVEHSVKKKKSAAKRKKADAEALTDLLIQTASVNQSTTLHKEKGGG